MVPESPENNDVIVVPDPVGDDATGEDLSRSPKDPNKAKSTPVSAKDKQRVSKRLNMDKNESGSDEETSDVSDTDFPFKDVIRLIANTSEATLSEVRTAVHSRRLHMLSDDIAEESTEFAALSTASGVINSVDA